MHCRLWASPLCFFLLVTFLSHRHHLALAAVLPTRSSSSSESSEAYSVAWSGPTPGDRFGSGDTIVGEWQVTPQNQKVVSPSFRLCVGGEDGCGATIWPEVVEESEGSYSVSLTAPSVNTESPYYLQMKDDFGHAYSSPIFNIAPTPQKKNKPAAAHSPPDVAQPRPDQAPMSASQPSSSSSSTGTTTGTTKSKSKGATDSNSDSASDPAAAAAAPPPRPDPNGILSPPSAGASSPSPPNSAATSSIPSSSAAGGSGPPLAQVAAAGAHNAPPAAAIAVPLSLTGAIILLAGGLALHHRRKLAAEKERASWPSSSWPRNKDAAGLAAAAAERTLFTRALFRGMTSSFHHHHDDDVYHHHRHGRFPEKAALSSYPSSYDCGAPLARPRQRTRELGLDPLAREFTTATRSHPSRRPRAHPSPSPSPSPSSPHRAPWDRRRYTLRRSTRGSSSDNANGGGSLWRSLSFAARQKKVLPPTPSSALNSPTMTVVTTSVTSDVLPSYLPSPRFDDGPAADRAHDDARSSAGDFGFETVPLSPPLPLRPAPLHTRGEASDPDDDSRMKELRGVYEAVARALGSTHGV